ncbi:hypothetical protein [Planomonospora sp. ID82291]|uniref:hypothetical protein n=1 Tax=Planomonospora sp. ID82291 TaxID=2738136 RepID=UPI0018C36A19|nr:hypothetical protein [Planomonospora sp. ID82291]MBG0819015.1 hypothetical protein [Planomonospora sp. ID82291]
MSGRHQPDDHDDAFDHWLDECQHALIEGLDTVLDVEAGLAEVLLHSRHSALVGDLGTALDVEAGLAEIVPAAASDLPVALPEAHVKKQEPVPAEQFLSLVSHQARFELRRYPDVVSIVRALAYALDLDFDLTRARVLEHDLTSSLTHALDLSHALNHARALTRSLIIHLTHAYTYDRNIPRGRDGDFVHKISRILSRDLFVTRALNRVRELNRVLICDIDRPLSNDIDRALTLTQELISFFVEEAQKVIGAALGRDLPPLPADSVRAFLEDFTTSDLRGVVLSGIDLIGVRWSAWGTRWPEAVDIETLKARSAEVPMESGIYVIRSGSAPERESVNLM